MKYCDRSTYRRCRFRQNKIIFSDEAHFDLGGYVNKQNCLWAQKTSTVWFWSRGIIGPFFLENGQGEAVTVNGDRYRAILNDFLFIKIEEEDIGNIWFQQDGATCQDVFNSFFKAFSNKKKKQEMNEDTECVKGVIQKEDIGKRTALRATQPKLHSMFCALFLKIALSALELMSFGHLGAGIWHRWTSFFVYQK